MVFSANLRCGSHVQNQVAPFQNVRWLGVSLNPSGPDYTGSNSMQEIGTFEAQFRGEPFTLDFDELSDPEPAGAAFAFDHPNHECLVGTVRVTKSELIEFFGSPSRCAGQIFGRVIFNRGGTQLTNFGTGINFPKNSTFIGDFLMFAFIGFVIGEIDTNGAHTCVLRADVQETGSGCSGSAFNSKTIGITVAGCGTGFSSEKRGNGSEGFIWIESTDEFHYIDDEQFEHRIDRFFTTETSSGNNRYLYVDTESGTDYGDVALTWTESGTKHKSFKSFQGFFNSTDGGQLWTGGTFLNQRGAILFAPTTFEFFGERFSNKFVRLDDGNPNGLKEFFA